MAHRDVFSRMCKGSVKKRVDSSDNAWSAVGAEASMSRTGSDDRVSPLYVGRCVLFRTLPRFGLVLAGLCFLTGSSIGALLFAAAALVVAAVLPWRFVVFDEGVLLSFALRQDRFFSKHDIAIRSDETGAVLYPTASMRRGYALSDGLTERRRAVLRAVLVRHGFRLT
jgi:hypothetical protein